MDIRMGRASKQIINGEPLPVALDMPFTIVCCDCSLAHALVLSSVGKGSIFLLHSYRDEFATKLARQKRRKSAHKKAKIAPEAIKGE